MTHNHTIIELITKGVFLYWQSAQQQPYFKSFPTILKHKQCLCLFENHKADLPYIIYYTYKEIDCATRAHQTRLRKVCDDVIVIMFYS